MTSSQETRDTISGLVASRAAGAKNAQQVADNFENTPTAHRDLRAIRTEEIYLFGVSVYSATGNLTLDCSDDLEMNPELGSIVKESEGRFTITVPVFPALKKAGGKLSSKRAAIQKKYLRYARPYWYVTRENMEALRDDLLKVADPAIKGDEDGLFVMCDKLRFEAMQNYEAAHTAYLERLERILMGTNLSWEKIRTLLVKYDEYFPSPDKIRDVFGVMLEGPVRIPSLVEEASNSADLSEQLEREARAEHAAAQQEIENYELNAERDRIRRQEAAVKELEAYWIQSIQESFAAGIESAKDDGYKFVAEILERIESTDPGDLNNRTKNYFDSRIRELQTCLDTLNAVQIDGSHPDPVLQRFAELTRQLKVLSTSGATKSKLEAKIKKLRATMKTEIGAVVANSQVKGHRAIARWMILDEVTPETPENNPATCTSSLILTESEPAVAEKNSSSTGMILDDAQSVAA